ncbi:enoyl-CoA hydratase-related protein [Methylocystis sp. JAN1]|uniref:enoyl-CoA hydratase-related protein n=1 Tax=Methylocystis sp. JAN1 TaxID=3397211 RepID=UPI003FA254A6
MGLVSSKDWRTFTPFQAGVKTTWLRDGDTLVVSKSRAGFDRASVHVVGELLREIENGAYPSLKFLVFDFAQGGAEATKAPEGFGEMVAANADLIVDTPVITLAWARSLMNGLDFDLAMNCSALVAESGARFSFAGEPFDLFGLYAALGRRIGFVKAERLIDSERPLSAAEAKELMLVKEVVPPQPEFKGIIDYLTQLERRYNASHAIFRAQRLAEPPIDRRPVDMVHRN